VRLEAKPVSISDPAASDQFEYDALAQNPLFAPSVRAWATITHDSSRRYDDASEVLAAFSTELDLLERDTHDYSAVIRSLENKLAPVDVR
jgi:hypothetical protein